MDMCPTQLVLILILIMMLISKMGKQRQGTRTTNIERKSYEYDGNFGNLFGEFGGEKNGKKPSTTTGNRDPRGDQKRRRRGQRKKLRFNFKKHSKQDDPKKPRKPCRRCPHCQQPWNGKIAPEQTDTELSGDEMVRFVSERNIWMFVFV